MASVRVNTSAKWSKGLVFTGISAAVLAFGVPSIGLAFSTGFDSQPVSIDARGAIGSFTPASVDPRLASSLKFSALRDGKMFRFTPAATQGEGKRAMTIAVRVRPDGAQAINIKPKLNNESGQGNAIVQITQSAFSLGVAKGFQKFAITPPQKSEALRSDAGMPDLSELGQGSSARKSRFTTKIEMDSETAPGRARTRAFDDQGGYSVDVGGSYRLTGNLNVTAGIRLKSERDRLDRLTNEQFDSQAVFVGTEFRF